MNSKESLEYVDDTVGKANRMRADKYEKGNIKCEKTEKWK